MKRLQTTAIAADTDAGSPSSRWSLSAYLAAAGDSWSVSQRTALAIALAPFAIAFLGGCAALLGKGPYKLLTREDGIAENLQVLCYILTLVLSVRIVARLWGMREKRDALLYAGLCAGLVFLIGEEVSWGQRILGWGTPEALRAINKQEETNLHNIYGVGATFKWVQLLVGAYGTVLPLILLHWPGPAALRRTISRVVPHYTLIPYFLLMFMWRIYRNLWDDPTRYYFAIAEYNEIIELTLAIGFGLFAVFQWRRLQGRAAPQ